jgi:hypothetical protein
MANYRRGKKGRSGRVGGGFIAIPWVVYDSPAYLALGRAAKNLLIDIARQFTGFNNGSLLCSAAYLKSRGWNSNSGLTDAKQELITFGFIYETVKGCRPNKASWYAITWQDLEPNPKYDTGAAIGFVKCLFTKHQPNKNTLLTPLKGATAGVIAPRTGIAANPTTPLRGSVKGNSDSMSIPLSGDHIDTPSAQNKIYVATDRDVARVNAGLTERATDHL